MGAFKILNAGNRAQYDIWINTWLSWGLHEIFAHPEYVNLFTRECDCAICAIKESSTGIILLPLTLRPLAAEVWAGENNKYYDVVTPYGFGGPYIIGNCDIAAFWHDFQQWAANVGVVSAFFRFSPFTNDIKKCVTDVDITGDVVIRSLVEGKEAVWQDYDRKVRSNIKWAEREGLWVEIDEAGRRLGDFIAVYYRTMQRRNALGMYYFQEKLFHELTNNLAGQFVFFHVIHRERVISSLLVLLSQSHMYAFLIGTDSEALNVHPNEILHHTAIAWGIEHNKKSYVLGGGYERGDGVFRFKKYFAPKGVVPFAVGKHIFDKAAYQSLFEKRERYELGKGRVWSNDTSYFPAYRSKWD